MIIFKIFEKHQFFLNILDPFFGTLKKIVKKWHGPLAIKTKESQKYFVFNTFFFERLRPSQVAFLFIFSSKNWEHSRAKIYNTLKPIRPSIHPLRRLIID